MKMSFFQSPAMTRRAFESVRDEFSHAEYRPRRNAFIQHEYNRHLCMDELSTQNWEATADLNKIDHEQVVDEQLVELMDKMSLPVKKESLENISKVGKQLLWSSLQKMNYEPEVILNIELMKRFNRNC